MSGKLYLDGKDAFSAFGIFVAEGGYNNLLAYPPLKKVNSIDWAEEHGVQFDLSAPMLDTREISIDFAAQGLKYKIGGFIEYLSGTAYHTFEFRDIGRTYKLRLVSQPNQTLARSLATFALSFADDFPLGGYTYRAPQSSLVAPQGYQIDGVSLSQYGVCVLDGTREQIEKRPAVKKNLLRNIGSQPGAIYDGQVVRFQTREVKIKCLMRAQTMSEFWRNYDALLFDLKRPGEHNLSVEETGCSYPFYYKNCSGTKFVQTDKIWFEFSLGTVLTSYESDVEEFVMASEQRELIITEDGSEAIDLD